MPDEGQPIGFVWWNANDFFHFAPDKASAGLPRWPKSLKDYEEKCQRVDAALSALFGATSTPTILGLGEVTSRAATELRDRLLPTYKVISLDIKSDDPSLQVAVIHAPSTPTLLFEEQPPLTVPATPRGTRPMLVLDSIAAGQRVRWIFCHWQARFEDGAEKVRFRIADFLSQYCYDFLSAKATESRHVVILGDLNEEPHGAALETLNAHRFRARAQGKVHWADHDGKRLHLYNTSWRLLGEQSPYPESEVAGASKVAGTYYWRKHNAWLHLDHAIVSGGLLKQHRPYLVESAMLIAALPEFLHDDLPRKFSATDKGYLGVSDHLPLVGTINI
jgi:endonuclease/exonuclease/phosphatase family metal-dependent hydrolase